MGGAHKHDTLKDSIVLPKSLGQPLVLITDEIVEGLTHGGHHCIVVLSWPSNTMTQDCTFQARFALTRLLKAYFTSSLCFVCISCVSQGTKSRQPGDFAQNE